MFVSLEQVDLGVHDLQGVQSTQAYETIFEVATNSCLRFGLPAFNSLPHAFQIGQNQVSCGGESIWTEDLQ